jgi:hypothetical protein
MKVIGITTAAVLSLILGIADLAYGQEQQGEKRDHNNQQEHAQQGKPEQQHAQQQQQHQSQEKQPQHAQQQPQPNENKQSAQHAQQQQEQNQQQLHAQQRQQQNQKKESQQAEQQQQKQNKQQHAQQQPQPTQQQQRVEQSAWQQHRSGNWQSDHRTWQQRGGYNGYRIPDDRYRGHLGPEHGFRISGLPFMVVGGYPRFQHGGYWFSLVDPWPENWGNSWYDTDDVYVGYVNNGYYLFNSRYPTVGIAISVSL